MLLALLLVVFALCLYGIRLNLKGINGDYLSKDSTNSIKGIFILLIVISHSLQYVRKSGYSFTGMGDMIFNSFFAFLGQLVVIMFLFYSGYGVGESYKRKKQDYISQFPKHRILATLLNYDVAVVVYIIFCILLGVAITFKQSLIAFTAWLPIGYDGWHIMLMDNWYIFVIILCYLVNYIMLSIGLSNRICQVVLLFVMSVACVIALSFLKSGEFWYNTILCYPLGFLYSSYKEKIEPFLKRYYWGALLALMILLVGAFSLFLSCQVANPFQLLYNAFCMLFVMTVVMVTMKVGIGNAPLRWAGSHLFPIFIYMRLPMLVMEQKTPALVGTYPAVFILIALAVTLLIARCYKYVEIKL